MCVIWYNAQANTHNSQTKETQMGKKETLQFKTVTTASSANVTFVKAAALKQGDIAAEGLFAGTVPNKFDENKPDIKIEDLNDSSKITIVNAAGNLGYQMSKINPGEIVRITYLGQQVLTKGKYAGKKSHNFEVAVAGQE